MTLILGFSILVWPTWALDIAAEPLPVPLPGLARAAYHEPDGLVWIPTDAGLVRLDGEAVRVFTRADGLPDDIVHVALRDAEGHLFVGTESGLGWIDGEQAQVVPGVPGPVFSLGLDADGGLLATAEQVSFLGRVRIEGGRPELTRVEVPEDWTGREVLTLADGRLIAGSDGRGLHVIDGSTATMLPGTDGTKAGPFAADPSGPVFFGTGEGVVRASGTSTRRWLPNRYITGVALLDEALYVGTGRGELWRIDQPLGDGTPTLVGEGPAISLFDLEVAGGMVFGATWGGGLVRHDPGDGSFDVFVAGEGLSSSVIRALSVDREGTLWVSTEGGVDVLSAFATDRIGREELGAEEVLGAALTNAGALAVGTPAGLALRTSDGWRQWTRDDGLSSSSVEGLIEVRPDELLLTGSAHGEGVSWLRTTEPSVEPVQEPWGLGNPRWGAVVIDLPSGWLVERHRGGVVLQVSPDGTIEREAALPKGAVVHGGATLDGETWLASSRGLLSWDRDFAPHPRVRDADIAEVASDGTSLWVVYTQGLGVDRLGADGTVATFDRDAGLPDRRALWVAPDGDGAWVGTRRGVARIEGDAVERVLGAAEGLPAAGFVGIADEQQLFIGGSEGLHVYTPRRHPDPPETLEPVVHVELGGEPAHGPVPWSRRELVARVDARTHVHRDGLRFRWRIAPAGTWSDWSRDHGIRSVLAPGAHRLEVEARSSHGTTGRIEVPIVVDPPWWRSWPAFVLAALGLLALGGLGGLTRVRWLEAARRELEAQVASRTTELQVLAGKLEQASEAKSRYLADMSHELRTPLNAIIGYTELLAEEARDTGAHELLDDLDRIELAAQHLQALINDVLDLSKIEAGKLELALADVDLVPLVDEVATALAPVVRARGNRLELDLPPSLTVHTDAHRVRQILTNLLGNAAKFTEDGTIAMRLAATEHGCALEVADSGCGIAPERLEHLFEPFVQETAETAARHGGTGLGLVISRELARLMRGDVTVRSEVGKGSTFVLELPR